MKRATTLWLVGTVAVALVAAAVMVSTHEPRTPAPTPERSGPAMGPNLILVLTDDQGWVGTSVSMRPDHDYPGNDIYRTPHLERLAKEGMRLSNAYSPGPNCRPSRAAIQTGKSPAQLHMTDSVEKVDKRLAPSKALIATPPVESLQEEEVTIAEYLAEHRPDVATAHFGKWHLKAGGPARHGYLAGDGATNNKDGATGEEAEDPKSVFDLTKRALEFMGEQVSAGRPFYVQLSHYALHSPFCTRPQTLQQTPRRRVHVAMTTDLDASLGELLDGLDAMGLAANTWVVFTSDNGSYQVPRRDPNPNGPLRGVKSMLWEGGIRVPMVVRGPGVPKGSHSAVPVTLVDVLPTLRELFEIEAPLPEGAEGGSLLGLWRGREAVTRPSEALVWHSPHYKKRHDLRPTTAMRMGDLKLLRDWETGTHQLFDLTADPREQTDLAGAQPQQVTALSARMSTELDRLGAVLPAANPAAPAQPERTP